ncbi:glycoside hydrolase family 88 protein [Amycolatopsis sp. FDAARGOS 1241]|uniref:glycoside hydrolase family 88 protein n=1 Tax=Amycolatopsis sp. FDAARGOS 1241 TaxID=2778070 RepID=UPI0019500282|nr:glycoside hydrolase family 88 protein [Amycolatopsis sp. FDAARGOS 1241]QRP44680.1 glycoside hydrolase family 88 protein [Amycolatopsis sp. FDAARGOS 1241]
MRFPGIRGFAVLAAAVTAGGLAPAATAAAAPAAPAAQCSVADLMVKAGDYWVAHGENLAPADSQNATFHVGNLAVVRTTGVSNHTTLPWGQANNYLLPATPGQPFRAEDEAAGEAYLDLYTYFHPDPPILADLRSRLADEVASVQAGHTAYWDHVGALNMAMPSFARIGVMDSSEPTLEAMQKLFHSTEKNLFDEFTGLWRTDARSIGYWSQGNGWALAALVKVLQVLPANDPRRPEYLRVFKKMATTLSVLQRPDGFWNANLLLPFGGPESSGTSLITYGLAWGVNAGVLDSRWFKPAVEKAWQALSTKAVTADGLVGYVQPKTDGPGPAAATDTSGYGVGAFLLAGQQVADLTPGCALPPAQ